MYYKAQANVSFGKLAILKGQSVTKEVFESLPERQKIKFKACSEASDEKPKNYQEIIGDTPEEKAKREQLAKEDADKKKAAEEAAAKKKAEEEEAVKKAAEESKKKK